MGVTGVPWIAHDARWAFLIPEPVLDMRVFCCCIQHLNCYSPVRVHGLLSAACNVLCAVCVWSWLRLARNCLRIAIRIAELQSALLGKLGTQARRRRRRKRTVAAAAASPSLTLAL